MSSSDQVTNEFGQPVGAPVDLSSPVAAPPFTPMLGTYCRLEPISLANHSSELYEAFEQAPDEGDWTYLPYGPFPNFDEFNAWLSESLDQPNAAFPDPMFFAIVDLATGKCAGMASYMRINPISRSIEAGHIHFARALQRRPAATEAMYLLMERAFASGYRRYEWKCDALNARSRSTAARLGLSHEGVFRQSTHYKGRNRDTAWFAILDTDWPERDAEFRRWLHPDNFDSSGQQRSRLRGQTD